MNLFVVPSYPVLNHGNALLAFATAAVRGRQLILLPFYNRDDRRSQPASLPSFVPGFALDHNVLGVDASGIVAEVTCLLACEQPVDLTLATCVVSLGASIDTVGETPTSCERQQPTDERSGAAASLLSCLRDRG